MKTGSNWGGILRFLYSYREDEEQTIHVGITFVTDGRLIAEITCDDSMLYESLPKCWTYG